MHEPTIVQIFLPKLSLFSRTSVLILILLCVSIALKPEVHAASIPVFPGAEGFGTDTVAGRGGEICLVENLNDSGNGSFRHCIEKSGPRVVLFTVGGTITVKSTLIIKEPFISIYGQSATGDGIMIKANEDVTGPVLRIASHDVLLQHLRLRAGASVVKSCCRDALSISNSEPGNVYNVVVDHASMSWGTDEVADIWYDSHNITISRSIISEGLNHSTNKGTREFAGRGFIIGSEGSHSISFHHNFLAHNYQRNPLVKSPGVTDVVNNLVYHWVSRAAGVAAEFGDLRANFVKNVFIAVSHRDVRQKSDKQWSDIAVNDHGNAVQIYLKDNYGYRRKYFFQSQERLLGVGKKKYKSRYGYVSETRHAAPKITETPVKSLQIELVKNVGANLPKQDSTDLRLFHELKTRSGKMPDCVTENDPPSIDVCKKNNIGGWPQYATGTPRVDTDRDGIPDDWERLNGLDAMNPDDASMIHSSGYSNVARWVHSL